MLYSHRRRVALAAVATSAALAIGAAPASAKVKKVKVPQVAAYNVEFTGSGTYDVNGTDSQGGTTAVKATFNWDVKYAKLIFLRSSGAEITTNVNPKKSKASGDWSIASTTTDGGDNCTTAGHFGLGQAGGIEGKVQGGGKALFKVSIGNPGLTTIGGDNGATACSTTDFWHDWVQSFSKIGNGEDGDDVDPITGFTSVDTDEFKLGKIIENVSNTTLKAPNLTIHPSCGGDAGTSCTQDFQWTGHLTLTKTKI